MLKKILPFLIILLIIIPVAVFFFFFKDKSIPDSQIDAIEAVPLDAVMAVETRSVSGILQILNSRQQIRDDLQLLEILSPYVDGINALDSLWTVDPSFSNRSGVIPGVWSLHQTADDVYQALLVLQTNSRFGAKDIADLGEQLSGQKATISNKTYSRVRIDHIIFSDTGTMPDIYVCAIKKYVIISRNDLLIENAIRQIKGGISLNQDADFRQAASVSGLNADASIFINLERFGSLSTQFLGSTQTKFLRSFNRYGSWLEFDLTFREDMVYGSGFGFTGDTLVWLGLFDKQEPPKNQLDKYLPAPTLGFLSYGFHEARSFLDGFQHLYAGSGIEKSRSQLATKVSRSLGEDPVAAFAGLMTKEAAIAWIPGSNEEPVPLVLISLKSQQLAFEKIQDWQAAKARKEGKRIQDYRHSYSLDQHSTRYYYLSPVENLPKLLFGEMFGSVKGQYFGFLDNHLVFTDHPQAIKDLNYFKDLEKTLYTDPVYQSVISQIGMRNNFVFYLAPFRSGSLISTLLQESWSDPVLKTPGFIQRIGAISLQVQSGSQGVFHNFFVKFSESEISKPQTVWESRLDTTLNFKPVFTLNHQTKRKEILLQDEGHSLYLLNTAGRQLWKLPLKEAINSEVYQIDYYKNGRLQFLFSTANALHLIDRNGNYVENYPVMLRAEASNGMALFDYDNRKEYRIFISGKDRGVYVYDKTGAIVKGWTFGKTEALVTDEIKHFRIGSKDYIVLADAMRCYILDRRGNTRVSPQKQFAKSARNGLVLDRQSSKGARLVGTDVEGMIWYVYFNGQVEEQKTSGYSAEHYFELEDIDGDGRHDFIFADQDRLEVLSADGKKIFQEKVQGYITHPPNIYVFPGNSREIGIVNRQEELIYLFNAEGKQHDGFPLRGRTPFSVGYLVPGSRDFNLIVGGDDKFLLNYRVK